MIAEGKTYSIEVMMQSLMTFRVPCKGANSPAKFIITTADENGGPEAEGSEKATRKAKSMTKDLRIFVSQEEKEPKDGRCDAQYQGESTFFVYNMNR